MRHSNSLTLIFQSRKAFCLALKISCLEFCLIIYKAKPCLCNLLLIVGSSLIPSSVTSALWPYPAALSISTKLWLAELYLSAIVTLYKCKDVIAASFCFCRTLSTVEKMPAQPLLLGFWSCLIINWVCSSHLLNTIFLMIWMILLTCSSISFCSSWNWRFTW